jgi:hypothetical protein
MELAAIQQIQEVVRRNETELNRRLKEKGSNKRRGTD